MRKRESERKRQKDRKKKKVREGERKLLEQKQPSASPNEIILT